MTDDRNNYKGKHIRWRDWDYSANAAYFVTICTQNKECFFGEIVGPDHNLGLNAVDSRKSILSDHVWDREFAKEDVRFRVLTSQFAQE